MPLFLIFTKFKLAIHKAKQKDLGRGQLCNANLCKWGVFENQHLKFWLLAGLQYKLLAPNLSSRQNDIYFNIFLNN